MYTECLQKENHNNNNNNFVKQRKGNWVIYLQVWFSTLTEAHNHTSIWDDEYPYLHHMGAPSPTTGLFTHVMEDVLPIFQL